MLLGRREREHGRWCMTTGADFHTTLTRLPNCMYLHIPTYPSTHSRSRNYDNARMTAGRRGDVRRSVADEEPREPLTLKVRKKRKRTPIHA